MNRETGICTRFILMAAIVLAFSSCLGPAASADIAAAASILKLDRDSDGAVTIKDVVYHVRANTNYNGDEAFNETDVFEMLKEVSPTPAFVGAVKGTVVRAEDPVAGATVQIRSHSGVGNNYNYLTDAAGTFNIMGLPAGDYDITVRKDDFGENTVVFHVDGAETLTLPNLQLPNMGGDLAGVGGIVVDSLGQPVANAAVTVTGTTYTDSKGRFIIANVMPGSYLLQADTASGQHAAITVGVESAYYNRAVTLEDPAPSG